MPPRLANRDRFGDPLLLSTGINLKIGGVDRGHCHFASQPSDPDNRVREQLLLRGMASDGEIDLEVSQAGESIKQFQTGTASALGGMIFAGRSVRVGRMMKTLAIRIAEGI